MPNDNSEKGRFIVQEGGPKYKSKKQQLRSSMLRVFPELQCKNPNILLTDRNKIQVAELFLHCAISPRLMRQQLSMPTTYSVGLSLALVQQQTKTPSQLKGFPLLHFDQLW